MKPLWASAQLVCDSLKIISVIFIFSYDIAKIKATPIKNPSSSTYISHAVEAEESGSRLST